MRQTAVEWMVNQLYTKIEMRGDGNLFDEILKQAKEMEKEQITDAYVQGSISLTAKTEAEQYYNETFKK